MKKIKMLFLSLIIVFSLTGCLKKDSMDNIDIYTTSYPIYYLIDSLYGFNSNIDSIYPKGIDINEYSLTEKQIEKYSKTNLFVYNGTGNEKQIAADFTNNNHKIKLIDASKDVYIKYDTTELWLSPSNYLMLAQNIKDMLTKYVSSTIINQEIEKKYDNLKLTIAEYDADLKTIAETASNKTLIVGDEVFKFLEKYGFEVLVIADNKDIDVKEYNKAKRLIENKTNSYIFVLDTYTEDKNVEQFRKNGANLATIHSMTNLTDEELNDGIDYIYMMNNFLEAIKTEVYN